MPALSLKQDFGCQQTSEPFIWEEMLARLIIMKVENRSGILDYILILIYYMQRIRYRRETEPVTQVPVIKNSHESPQDMLISDFIQG